MGAAAVPITFAGGLAGCGGEERKMEWVRPRVPFTLDEPQIDRTWLLCAPLG